MLCYVMLCYVMLCYVILYYASYPSPVKPLVPDRLVKDLSSERRATRNIFIR